MANITDELDAYVAVAQSSSDGGSTKLAKYSASCHSVPGKDRFEFWSDLNQPAFSMKPVFGPDELLDASVDLWREGQFTFADMRFRPGNRRPYLIDIGQLDREMLVVRVFNETDQCGILGEEAVKFASDDVHIYPFGSSFRSVTTHLEQLTAYIPYDAVGYDPSTYPRHIDLKASSALAYVVRAAMKSFLDTLRNADRNQTTAGSNAFAGLIRGVLNEYKNPMGQREIFERARGFAFRSYIKEHLCDMNLTVEKVCRTFGASRATVYREFAQEGGIVRYIQRLRLQRALLDLAKSNGARGIVAGIAQNYGYSDTSNFSRAFRQQFGAAPTEYVGQQDCENVLREQDLSDMSLRERHHIFDWICGVDFRRV